MARAEIKTVFVVENFDGREDFIVVKKWLAHAHKRYVVDFFVLRVERARPEQNLLNYFACGEVAGEAETACRAKLTFERTTDLAGNADGVAGGGYRRGLWLMARLRKAGFGFAVFH